MDKLSGMFYTLKQNPITNPYIPLATGIAQAEADANQQIQSEIEEYKEEHKGEFDDLVQQARERPRPPMGERPRPPMGNQEAITPQNPELQRVPHETPQHLLDLISDTDSEMLSVDSEDELNERIDQLAGQLPEGGAEVLQENRDNIRDQYGWLLKLVTADTAGHLAKWLWEMIYTGDRGVGPRPQGAIDYVPEGKAFDEKKQKKFEEKHTPVHCRREYYFDQESGRVKSMLVCVDEKYQTKRIYHDK